MFDDKNLNNHFVLNVQYFPLDFLLVSAGIVQVAVFDQLNTAKFVVLSSQLKLHIAQPFTLPSSYSAVIIIKLFVVVWLLFLFRII